MAETGRVGLATRVKFANDAPPYYATRGQVDRRPCIHAPANDCVHVGMP
jgi:hypothetical protein